MPYVKTLTKVYYDLAHLAVDCHVSYTNIAKIIHKKHTDLKY